MDKQRPLSKLWILHILIMHIVMQQLTAQVKYTVPAIEWQEPFGNHRAVLQIEMPGDIVALDLLWRRHDKNPEDRQFIITNAVTGDTITNIYRYEVNNERCRIAFGPVNQPGAYYFYYLPYTPEYKDFSAGKYLTKENEPEKEWLHRIGLTGGELQFDDLPKCNVDVIQARSEFHSFYPMEVPATKEEIQKYVSKYDDPYLVFPEDRIRPIRMLDALPLIWLQSQPSSRFRGTACKNEYYALQLGVYASKVSLKDLEVNFSDLVNDSGDRIPASAMTCFNTHGVDIEGEPFVLTVNVEKGKVQPLWIGIDISKKAVPGNYKGIFTVEADGLMSKQLEINIKVENSILTDRGDGETWRHSRLRWLNSTIGIDDEPVTPYTNISVNERKLSCLGRDIELNQAGLPESVLATDNDVLDGAIKFLIESNNQVLSLEPVSFQFTKSTNGVVAWEAISENDELRLTCKGEMEFDGRFSYDCMVAAKKNIHLQDIRLEIPYRKSIAQYMIGMGRMGGHTPEFHKSRWRREEDSFWLGNAKGGLHCELRGGSYHGPLLNLYQPNHPRSWYNGVNGGFRIDTKNETVNATAYSGYRPMHEGEEVTYKFALIVTPVKPYNPNDQWQYKYEHNPKPRKEVVDNGGNMMNVHHANKYNPYINYPFIVNDTLKALVDKWHERDWKVKIYYTVRELSNYLTEMWALRSLGFEILSDGPGGGYQWLQEHLVDNYTCQWYNHIGDGTADAAILNSGESRWYNYYLEGLAWLLKEIDIDGLYLDDFSYDRRILKRMRKIMENIKPGECHIDVHSNNAFTRGPANQYLEIYPYINRTWYGEGFNFDLMPADFWFSEVSGVPFGVVNELLLHRSVNKGRRGMIYAMAPRGDWAMWELWKNFGIENTRMIGYWEDNVPVEVNDDRVKVTSYVGEGKTLIVLGNWESSPLEVKLSVDWKALGLNKKKVKIHIPEITNYQKEEEHKSVNFVKLDAKGVKFIILSEE
jgi:hypothetical protein